MTRIFSPHLHLYIVADCHAQFPLKEEISKKLNEKVTRIVSILTSCEDKLNESRKYEFNIPNTAISTTYEHECVLLFRCTQQCSNWYRFNHIQDTISDNKLTSVTHIYATKFSNQFENDFLQDPNDFNSCFRLMSRRKSKTNKCSEGGGVSFSIQDLYLTF